MRNGKDSGLPRYCVECRQLTVGLVGWLPFLLATCLTGLPHHFADDPSMGPDPDDPPLAGDVEAFVNGATHTDLSRHFAQWTEALGRLKVQDRQPSTSVQP